MLGKISLYYYTIRNMKPSQVFNRIRIRLGYGCALGVKPTPFSDDVSIVDTPSSLDYDPVFLDRFPADELMNDRITILHSTEDFDWKSKWEIGGKSDLWNYNLHYFEYIFPLVKKWNGTGDRRYLNKSFEILDGWIESNPQGTKPAWASYTIALRIVNWISFYTYVREEMPLGFKSRFLSSLYSQYCYLSRHLEKDILGNHYFEDLKCLVIASIFFKDEKLFSKAIQMFKKECEEEILQDGMHFELSPMYHKIVLEGIMRTAIALRGSGRQNKEIEKYLQPMLDVAYTFENELNRIPLFNDSGNNVAKSLESIIDTATSYFNIKPRFKTSLETSGFYFFRKNINGKEWRLIVDAGQPGPKYIPGHAHCDAMSFELFCDGKPIAVNCGTYAYQDSKRYFFRSTAAHNTVMVDDTEQSQIWGIFRLAKRSKTKVLSISDSSIAMEMRDQKGNVVNRTITLNDNLVVKDFAKGHNISSFIHLRAPLLVRHNVLEDKKMSAYAEDYGDLQQADAIKLTNKDVIEAELRMESLSW